MPRLRKFGAAFGGMITFSYGTFGLRLGVFLAFRSLISFIFGIPGELEQIWYLSVQVF